MIKSPTFGFLTSDRPLPTHQPNPSLDNPSLALHLENSTISKNFGNPDISPIHNHPHPKKQLKTSFMDFSYPIHSI
jgi:hypothetical protein